MAKNSASANSLESLMVPSNSGDEVARRQLKALEDLRASATAGNSARAREDADIKDITRAKSTKPSVVTLGNVRDELRGIKEGVNKKELPSGGSTGGLDQLLGQGRDQGGMDAGSIMKKLGGIADLKSEIEQGGSRNELLTAKNQETFQKFIAETKNRSDLLGGANEDQVEIFKKIEQTLIDLQGANSEDSNKLRQKLAEFSGEFRETQESASKKTLEGIIANARASADVGRRGNQGTLGDAFAALTGKKTVLKSGFEYDSRLTGKGGAPGIKNTATGRIAGAAEAGMGRIAGFASILGNFVGNKIEQSVEGKRSERVQGFLDNFRTSDQRNQGSFLQGQQSWQSLLVRQAQSIGSSRTTSGTGGAQIIPFPGRGAGQRATGTDVSGITQAIKSGLRNLRVQSVKIDAAKVEVGDGSAAATPDSGTLRSDVKYVALDPETPQQQPAGGIDIDSKKPGGMSNLLGGGAGAFALGNLAVGGLSVAMVANEQNKMYSAAAEGNIDKAERASRASTQYQAGAMSEFADPIQQQEMAQKEAREALQAQADKGNEKARAKLAEMDMPLSQRDPAAFARIEAAKKKTSMLKQSGISYSKWRGTNIKEGTGLFGSNWFADTATDKDISQALNPSMAQARPPAAPSGTTVSKVSNQNSQAKMDAAQPKVVIAPAQSAPAAPPVTQVTNNMPRGRVRPEESHLERYQARTSGSFIY